MNRLTITAVAVALTLGFAAQASAGHCHRKPIVRPVPVITYPQPIVTVRPITYPQPAPAPIVNRSYYFGMSLQLIQTQYGIGLQVASVTPGGPAARAGLELGDILLSSGSTSFRYAQSNLQGVDMLQRSVVNFGGGIGGGGPVPTATTLVSTRIAPRTAYADLQVLDVRTGVVTPLRVNPEPIGGIGGPIPTAASPVPAMSAPVPAMIPQPTATATR